MAHPRSILALGVIAATLVLTINLISSRSEAQFTATAQPVGNWWPPHPRDQIQLIGETPQLTSGQSHVIFQVPNDRWLVIVPGASPAPGFGSSFFLSEDLAGAVSDKAQSGNTYWQVKHESMSPLGWTFRPGSSVVLRHPGGGTQLGTFYSLFGYLAPP